MLFLIEYDRSRGSIVHLGEFDASARRLAEDARIELELGLNRNGIEHEVVILDAPSKEALLRTHSRYFESVAEMVHGSPQVQALIAESNKLPLERER